jgi:hypothetical protein
VSCARARYPRAWVARGHARKNWRSEEGGDSDVDDR